MLKAVNMVCVCQIPTYRFSEAVKYNISFKETCLLCCFEVLCVLKMQQHSHNSLQSLLIQDGVEQGGFVAEFTMVLPVPKVQYELEDVTVMAEEPLVIVIGSVCSMCVLGSRPTDLRTPNAWTMAGVCVLTSVGLLNGENSSRNPQGKKQKSKRARINFSKTMFLLYFTLQCVTGAVRDPAC